MAKFPCTHFTFSTRYPESGTRIQFGNSYAFDAGPTAPDQRVFTLTLAGMIYFLDSSDDLEIYEQPWRNMAVLEAFYNEHKRYKSFDFDHPVYGTLKCKFNRPLEIPEGIPNGGGVLDEFTVELIEVP